MARKAYTKTVYNIIDRFPCPKTILPKNNVFTPSFLPCSSQSSDLPSLRHLSARHTERRCVYLSLILHLGFAHCLLTRSRSGMQSEHHRVEYSVIPGFETLGNRASGSILVENGRQPRARSESRNPLLRPKDDNSAFLILHS